MYILNIYTIPPSTGFPHKCSQNTLASKKYIPLSFLCSSLLKIRIRILHIHLLSKLQPSLHPNRCSKVNTNLNTNLSTATSTDLKCAWALRCGFI